MYKPITPPLTWDHMIGSLDELLANLDIPLIKRKLLIEQVQHLYQGNISYQQKFEGCYL